MKIIVTAAPLAGHLNPLLAAGRMLAEDGHEVIAYTASVFRSSAEAHGLGFRPFPGRADVDMRDLDTFFPERKLMPQGFETLRVNFERIFMERTPDQYAGLQALTDEFEPDVIIAGGLFYATLPMLLGPRSKRPAIIHCGAIFLGFSRDDGALPFSGLPPARNEEERAAYREIAKKAQDGYMMPLVHYLNSMLDKLGRPPLAMTSFFDASVMLPDFYLQPGVPSLEYPRRNLPSTLRFIGALPTPARAFPLPDWAGDLDGPRKIVLVTQGTVANFDLGRLIAPAFAALADEPDLLVVAATGGRPIETLPGTIPPNARIAEFLPFDWLLPKLDLLVTNGGYGSVLNALSLGIPLVIAGTTEDKKEVSARVTWSGVGISLGTDHPEPADIKRAVRLAFDTPTYKSRAAAMAQEFESYDPHRIISSLVAEAVQNRHFAEG